MAHFLLNQFFLLVITVQNTSNLSGKILKKIKSRRIYGQIQNEAPKIVYTPYVNEYLGIGDLSPLQLTNHLTTFKIGIYQSINYVSNVQVLYGI